MNEKEQFFAIIGDFWEPQTHTMTSYGILAVMPDEAADNLEKAVKSVIVQAQSRGQVPARLAYLPDVKDNVELQNRLTSLSDEDLMDVIHALGLTINDCVFLNPCFCLGNAKKYTLGVRCTPEHVAGMLVKLIKPGEGIVFAPLGGSHVGVNAYYPGNKDVVHFQFGLIPTETLHLDENATIRVSSKIYEDDDLLFATMDRLAQYIRKKYGEVLIMY